MNLKRTEFYSTEQFHEHKAILKLPGVRCYNLVEQGNAVLVFYKQGLADNEFMVMYYSTGGTALFFHHASFDNAKTLKELLSVPNRTYMNMNSIPDREPNIPEETFVE